MAERASNLFRNVVSGLTAYYPDLKDEAMVVEIRAMVKVPDTGNDQADYESTRDQVERLVQKRNCC